eukprot:scaffold5333_cov49-Attheya_sp.AAC.4
MVTLEERVCGLEDRVVVMRRLIMGMAQEIETLRGELGHEGQSTMAVTEAMLPTQETTAESDRLAADVGQHVSAGAKRSHNKSSNPQHIPLFRFTVVHIPASNVVATKLDARQLVLEAEIQKATQESTQGQAEG